MEAPAAPPPISLPDTMVPWCRHQGLSRTGSTQDRIVAWGSTGSLICNEHCRLAGSDTACRLQAKGTTASDAFMWGSWVQAPVNVVHGDTTEATTCLSATRCCDLKY